MYARVRGDSGQPHGTQLMPPKSRTLLAMHRSQYAVTGSTAARDTAWATFEGLHLIMRATGGKGPCEAKWRALCTLFSMVGVANEANMVTPPSPCVSPRMGALAQASRALFRALCSRPDQRRARGLGTILRCPDSRGSFGRGTQARTRWASWCRRSTHREFVQC